MREQTLPNPMTDYSLESPAAAPLWRVNRFGERVLEAVNGEAFDKLGARLTLEEAFRGRLDAQDTLYVIVGSDSGHLVEYVRRQSPPRGTRYLFVDPPGVHAALHAAGLLDDLPSHIRCAPAHTWTEAAQALHLTDYLYIDAVEVVFSLAAQSSTASEYVELAWGLNETVASLRWQAFVARGSEAFIASQIVNAADNVHSAARWRGALAGR
ncbi:MAG: hypothetical protein ACUVVU_06450, partial [Tepidimonas sp.]|uniref:hypothetical protein n=1 Tax=Tepidimonas sp. TaxID=2002775 RepID=UPI004054C44D